MNLPSAVHPSASAYNAQLQIRREAEERSIAQQDLKSWIKEIKCNKELPNANGAHSKTAVESVNATTTLEQKSLKTNDSGSMSFEEERIRGNSFFAQGKYQDAIQCYNRCLCNKDALNSPVVYSNRGKPSKVPKI
jgi:tetratricopeptide (TPR) repeat protein